MNDNQIKEALSNLKVTDQDRVVFVNSEHWSVDLMRELHNGTLPNDWTFNKVREVLISLDELGDTDSVSILDGLIDFKTYELHQWLNEYQDSWFDNVDFKEYDKLYKLLQAAQAYHIEWMIQTILNWEVACD